MSHKLAGQWRKAKKERSAHSQSPTHPLTHPPNHPRVDPAEMAPWLLRNLAVAGNACGARKLAPKRCATVAGVNLHHEYPSKRFVPAAPAAEHYGDSCLSSFSFPSYDLAPNHSRVFCTRPLNIAQWIPRIQTPPSWSASVILHGSEPAQLNDSHRGGRCTGSPSGDRGAMKALSAADLVEHASSETRSGGSVSNSASTSTVRGQLRSLAVGATCAARPNSSVNIDLCRRVWVTRLGRAKLLSPLLANRVCAAPVYWPWVDGFTDLHGVSVLFVRVETRSSAQSKANAARTRLAHIRSPPTDVDPKLYFSTTHSFCVVSYRAVSRTRSAPKQAGTASPVPGRILHPAAVVRRPPKMQQ